MISISDNQASKTDENEIATVAERQHRQHSQVGGKTGTVGNFHALCLLDPVGPRRGLSLRGTTTQPHRSRDRSSADGSSSSHHGNNYRLHKFTVLASARICRSFQLEDPLPTGIRSRGRGPRRRRARARRSVSGQGRRIRHGQGWGLHRALPSVTPRAPCWGRDREGIVPIPSSMPWPKAKFVAVKEIFFFPMFRGRGRLWAAEFCAEGKAP